MYSKFSKYREMTNISDKLYLSYSNFMFSMLSERKEL